MKDLLKYLYPLLASILIILLNSCGDKISQKEDDGDDEGEEIHISVKSLEDYHDDKIKELRIMAFNHDTQIIAYNIYEGFTDELGKNIIKIHLLPGTYDFAFIANERSDNSLHLKLSAFGKGAFSSYETLEHLYDDPDLRFSFSAFATDKHIPMSHFEEEVKIIGNRTYKIKNNTQQTDKIWPVTLTRLGVRVDLTFKTLLNDKKDNFEKLFITQIPKTVPIFQDMFNGMGVHINGGTGNFDATTDREIRVAEGDDKGWVSENENDPSSYYIWKKTRIILPASMFSPSDDKNQGIVVKAVYTNIAIPDGATLGLHTPGTTTVAPGHTVNTPPYDYTLPRNTYMEFIGRIIEGEIEFEHIRVSPWGKKEDIPVEN